MSTRERALVDPVGVVVDLLGAVDTGLGAEAVAAVVTAVAGGRAKRRRLALALLDNPSVLTTGRSPAPSAVGELLLALRRGDAAGISAPYCAGCGREITSIQRRGEDWYCAGCFTRPQPCASCGHRRYVASRDRQGQPRCGQCPDEDPRDPLAALVAAIRTVDASLPAAAVVDVVQRTVSKPGHWLRLAWIIEDSPALLTGDGSSAPVPALLRLIDALHAAGASAVVRPACPLCRRVMALSKKKDGQRICRACSARARAIECAQCGKVREPAARDEQSRPLCADCLVNTPINQEPCHRCRRRRRVSVRTVDGPLCETCKPSRSATCTICGRTGPCLISKTTGTPWCRACQQRRVCCVDCGRRAQIRSGTIDAPRCGQCTVPDPGFWQSCPSCGTTQRLTSGPCSRCNLHRQLDELLSGPNGGVRPELQLLHNALAQVDRPSTVLGWLSKHAVRVLLAELAAGRRPLTHARLDQLPPSKTLAHLRAVLVATGSIPERDEHLAGLERWIAHTITTRTDPDQRQQLNRYAVWHLLRRLRGRNRAAHATHAQVSVIRRHVCAAMTLLEWLTTRDLTLATCRQDHLDQWLTSDITGRREAGHFVRWAIGARLTRPDLSFPATRWAGPLGAVNAEHRWSVARRLLHDDTLKVEDRVAGLLLLLYAQRPATISRLTIDQVEHQDTGTVLLHLGSTPVVLPEPLAALMLTLVATRTGHAVIGAGATTPWLFPGGRPGHPVSAYQMGQRLHGLDIQPATARSTALLQLAAELPAAILARTSVSTSASPSHGNAPPPRTGLPTPPNLHADEPLPLHDRRQTDPFRQLEYPNLPVAIYTEDVVSHHRAFIARRRAERPSEEYRDLSDQEWNEFLAHFELRKVALGTCGRDYGTPCAHENACVRCPLLRVDPAQMPRLETIRANLTDRLQEAKDQGWLGEVAAIETTLAAAAQKLGAMRGSTAAGITTVHLGMPDVRRSAGRSSSDS